MPIGYVIGNINAFALGARSVNPKAEVRVVATGSWSDKAKEAAATNALIDDGADVIAMHVDSPATVIQVAESRGVYSIGFQSIEARALAPKGWITGLGFTWGPFMTATAKSVMDGTFKPAMVREGLGEMIAIAPFGPAVPEKATPALVDRGGRQGREGLQSLHRADRRQYRGRPHQGGRSLGRRQDGQSSTGTSPA